MEQLTAYKILGLEPNCSPEEIKEAYAALSKQYHPEEEPEKFQEIHEAYVTLARRKRRGSVEYAYHEKQAPILEETEPEYDFDKIKQSRDSRMEQGYNFEDALVKAEQQSQQKLYELVVEAAAELKVLTSPKYDSNLKAYKAFFEDKKYEPIIKKAEFLQRLCAVLEETKLKKQIYNYIIEFYRLRGMQPSDLSPIGLRLYQVLDEKVGIKKKVHPGLFGGITAGVICIFNVIRPIVRQYELASIIVLCLFAVALFVWIFKKLSERRSVLLAQAVIAICLAISQFVIIMFDGYGTAFGTVDDGNSVAAMTFILACAWLLVVVVIAIIKAVVKLISKKM